MINKKDKSLEIISNQNKEIVNTAIKEANDIAKIKAYRDVDRFLDELDEMLNNPEKYPRYTNWEDLKKALISDDNV